MMQVTISVPGIFHAFHMAEGLEARNALSKLYTTFPRFALDTDLPHSRTVSIVYPEVIMQAGAKLPWIDRVLVAASAGSTTAWKNRLFDVAVSRRLQSDEDGLFVGFAGCSRKSLRRADDIGLTTVLERSSSHVRTQAEILEAEYEIRGIDSPTEPERVDSEEREYARADYIATPSEFAYESFIQRGFAEDELFLIPFGTELPPKTESQKSGGDRFCFLFAGHVNLRKGVPYLLEAWDRLSLDATLILTSGIDETLRPLVEEYNDDETVQFLGRVDDLGKWFRHADVFVFPSLEEGSARVTYEAMAHGLPLVTTFNSGWVGEDGVHGMEVPIRDPDALASAMERLYHRRTQRERMGEAARELIGERYTLADYQQRIYDVYESIVE
jgi:glycosyltransferase involved in cell wall biosynthesis